MHIGLYVGLGARGRDAFRESKEGNVVGRGGFGEEPMFRGPIGREEGAMRGGIIP